MTRSRLLLLLAAGAVALFSAALAVAGPVTFTIPFFTVDGGGGSSTGGPYTVTGTAGQPDAGVMNGGPYEIRGGFWGGAGALSQNAIHDWKSY